MFNESQKIEIEALSSMVGKLIVAQFPGETKVSWILVDSLENKQVLCECLLTEEEGIVKIGRGKYFSVTKNSPGMIVIHNTANIFVPTVQEFNALEERMASRLPDTSLQYILRDFGKSFGN